MSDLEASAHRRVVADYYRTTSSAGAGRDTTALRSSLIGLRQRLRPWDQLAGLDVIDLGSGLGELCALAKQLGARRATGVNLSTDEIAVALQWVDAEFVCSDVVGFMARREAASADVIFALNLLEHLDKDGLVSLLESAVRVLRPGGRLVAMVPNAMSPFGGMTRYWDITHQNAFTVSSVRQLSRLVGFGDQVEFRECGPVPHGLVSGARYLMWQGIRAVIAGYLLIELASTKGRIYTADMMFRLTRPSE
jgi:SAM-dependent methyltransferase